MPTGYEVQIFAKPTGTPTATHVLTFSSMTTVKALVLHADGTALDTDGVGHFRTGHGISDGTTHFAVAMSAVDAVPTNTQRRHASKAITFMDELGALLFEATASISGNQVTLTFDPNNNIGHYIVAEAFGDDVCPTLAKVVTAQLNTSNGNQDITCSGLVANAPTLVIALSGINPNAPPSTIDHATLAIGIGTLGSVGSGQCCLVCGDEHNRSAGGNNAEGVLLESPGHLIGGLTPKGNVWDPYCYGDLTSIATAGQFRINLGDAPSLADYWGFLVLQGGQYEVRFSTVPGSLGDQDLVGAYQGTPIGVRVSSKCDTSTAIAADLKWAIGAASGVAAEGSVWCFAEDATPETGSTRRRRVSNSQTIYLKAGGTSGYSPSAGNVAAFISGGVTIDWDDVAGGAFRYSYCLLGAAVAAGDRRRVLAQGW